VRLDPLCEFELRYTSAWWCARRCMSAWTSCCRGAG